MLPVVDDNEKYADNNAPGRGTKRGSRRRGSGSRLLATAVKNCMFSSSQTTPSQNDIDKSSITNSSSNIDLSNTSRFLNFASSRHELWHAQDIIDSAPAFAPAALARGQQDVPSHLISSSTSEFHDCPDSVSMLSSDIELLSQSGRTASDRSMRSSTSIIEPKSDSVRSSLTRAASSMSMTHLRFSDTVIYGREEEVASLQEVFADAKRIDRQLVLLSGSAGVGKSALAMQMKPTALRGGGFFIRGKFDQFQNEPYSAFSMALRELCDGLLAHKEHPDINSNKWQFTFEEFQTKLKAELTKDNRVFQALTTVFPDLLQILGGNYLSVAESSTAIGYNEAKNQFDFAFRRLIGVVTSFGRVVLFLDDIHWADAASLDLMKALLVENNKTHEPISTPQSDDEQKDISPSDPSGDKEQARTARSMSSSQSTNTSSQSAEHSQHEQPGLVVMASFRTEAINEDHPVSVMIQEVEETEARYLMRHVPVNNLGESQVNEMLCEVLSASSPEVTLPLANCVHRKTQGNGNSLEGCRLCSLPFCFASRFR